MDNVLNQERRSFFDPLELFEQNKGLMSFDNSKTQERYLSPFYAERGIIPGQTIVTDTPVSEFNYTGKDEKGNEGKSYSTHLLPFSRGSEIYPAFKKDVASFPQNLLRLYYEESQSNNLFNFSGKFCLFNMGDNYYSGIIKKFPKGVESFYQKGEKKLNVSSLEEQAEYMKLIADSKSHTNTLTEVEIYRALKLAVWHRSPQGSFEEIVGSINDLLADGVLWVAKGLDAIKISEKRYLADTSEYEPFLGGSEPMKFVLKGGLATLQNMISSGIKLLKIGGHYFLPKGFENIVKSLDTLTTDINESVSRLKKNLPETFDHTWKLGNAFFCGLLNGLISLLEFVLQAIAFLLGIDGIIKNYEDYAESRYYSEIMEEVLHFLFSEIPLLLNGFTALLLDVKNLNGDDIENLLRLVKEKIGNVSQYQLAYYAGGIVFEVIVGVLLAVFTGGAGNIAKAASTSEKFAQYIKIIGREFVSSVSFGISDILAIFRGLVRSFIKACENGFEGFIKWIRSLLKTEGKHLDEVLDEVEQKPIGGKGPLGKGSIIGKYSKRPFNPENAGGPILKLKWTKAKITKEGIEIVKKHLSRFESTRANKKMIERLEKIEKKEIEITDWDKRFYTHELREYERYQNLGVKDGVHLEEVYNDAHTATLEDFKLSEFDENGVDNIYHPSIPEIDFHF